MLDYSLEYKASTKKYSGCDKEQVQRGPRATEVIKESKDKGLFEGISRGSLDLASNRGL